MDLLWFLQKEKNMVLGSGVSKIKRVIDAGMAKVNKRLDKLSGVDEDSAGRTSRTDRGRL